MAGKKPTKAGSDLPKVKMTKGTKVPKNPTKKPFGNGAKMPAVSGMKRAK